MRVLDGSDRALVAATGHGWFDVYVGAVRAYLIYIQEVHSVFLERACLAAYVEELFSTNVCHHCCGKLFLHLLCCAAELISVRLAL